MKEKRIIWDAEKSNRLYDYKARNPGRVEGYFGFQVGEAIVRFCEYFVVDLSSCNVLDYGCGMGHIIGCFLAKGVNVTGVDMSPKEVEYVNKHFGDNENFHGAKKYDGGKLPFGDNSFDLITCTECIEHVLDLHMDNMLFELKRILKPNGIILLTTPNEERISESEVYCPECNTVFHRHGHVRTFSISSLKAIMEEHGYKTIACDSTDFSYIQSYLHCPKNT